MARFAELGRATTEGQTLPLGSDDPVLAARAVRRALAAAHRRAADVTDLVLAAEHPVPASVLASFARRALGPHGSSVRTTALVGEALDAAGLAGLAAAAAAGAEAAAAAAGAEAEARDAPGRGLVIAIGIAPDGTTEARCLAREAPGRAGAGSADHAGDLGVVG